ncbi:MAG: alanine--tRNA ligase [Calditrichia bacterium]
MKTSKQIRREFIDFFEKKKDHTFVPSSPVVPHDDPTLLFINAGMNQFKDVFLETGTRPYKRAANSQKCIRVSGKHNDLEEVGHDTYHHTYFEMLGNWSFGDYFKEDAIKWAWELLTEVWGIPKERLYATVFGGDKEDGTEADTEAESLWAKVTDINPDHIIRCGKEDNFWEMGETGPCGPCSEVHIDLTPDMSGKDLVNGDSPLVMEIWNLVFIQYNRVKGGALNKLPAQHVDTGMGFERIVAVLQNKKSNYDTDVFTPILDSIGKQVGLNYEKATEEQQIVFRVIADHVRMLTFSISDGAMPSNDGRGYVLRRLLRRAARYGRKLNMKDPFIYKIVKTVVDINGEAFPELVDKASYIMEVIKSEEESFNKTLDRGIELFGGIVEELKNKNIKTVPGSEAFKLYDTFGFPLDLTRVMAQEIDMDVDESGFEAEMSQQKDRARAAGKFSAEEGEALEWQVINEGETEFVGYENLNVETTIRKWAKHDNHVHVVLEKTPFYAESGGQVGDQGIIQGNGFKIDIVETRKQSGENVSIGALTGEIGSDVSVEAGVDIDRRNPTIYNHTATHLLHAALRDVLGDHVQQAGSLVAPDGLRFDFTHFKKIESDELQKIELMVNSKIQENMTVSTYSSSFDEAKAKGAMALFGEKYGDVVRVVDIAPFSVELCGGCHVQATGEIGPFIITQESSVAAGVRRIEALTGPQATRYMLERRNIVNSLEQLLNTPASELADRVHAIQEKARQSEKELQKLQAGKIIERVDEFIAGAEKIGDVSLVIEEFSDVDVDLLKQVGDTLRQKSTKTVGFLVNKAGGKVNFVCAVTDDLIKERSLKAGDLIREAAKMAGGGGGGRPHLATAGAKDASKLPDVYAFLRSKLA